MIGHSDVCNEYRKSEIIINSTSPAPSLTAGLVSMPTYLPLYRVVCKLVISSQNVGLFALIATFFLLRTFYTRPNF